MVMVRYSTVVMVEIEADVFTICQRLRDGQVTVPNFGDFFLSAGDFRWVTTTGRSELGSPEAEAMAWKPSVGRRRATLRQSETISRTEYIYSQRAFV